MSAIEPKPAEKAENVNTCELGPFSSFFEYVENYMKMIFYGWVRDRAVAVDDQVRGLGKPRIVWYR
jgi:hypothetical protein